MSKPAGKAARKYPPKNANWISDDSVSVRLNAFFRCGMRMSLRLTPMAHKKNRLVTRMNGTRYRRSVMGAEEFMIFRSGQRAIEMNVAAVHEKMLAGDMTRLG